MIPIYIEYVHAIKICRFFALLLIVCLLWLLLSLPLTLYTILLHYPSHSCSTPAPSSSLSLSLHLLVSNSFIDLWVDDKTIVAVFKNEYKMHVCC